MKFTSPIPFLFPKNIMQPVPVYKWINLHNMVFIGALWKGEKGLGIVGCASNGNYTLNKY